MSKTIEQKEAEIKKHWFKNHVATVTKHDDVTILDWKEPGTNMYAVRYIFAGSRLFISGDIGDAVYWLTWKATMESFEDVGLHYLMGKLTCCSRERWDFDSSKAKKELRDWYKGLVKDGCDKECLEVAKEIRDGVRAVIDDYSYFNHYQQGVFQVYHDVDQDYFDTEDFSMIADFGKELPIVFVAYLLGIKMANEQLKVAQ